MENTEQIALTADEKKAQQIIINEVDKAVNLLVSHLNKFCVENKAGSVPFVYIKTSADILLKSYKEGAEKA